MARRKRFANKLRQTSGNILTAPGITSDKVPTEIGYTEASPNNGSTSSQNIKWGFQFRPEETRLRCIKLFLDKSQKLPHFVSPLETALQLRKFDKTVMEAVSDYLTQIYKHTMETLTKRYGKTFMSQTKVQFVLTVPAVWSDSAKDATLKAAEKAGLGSRHELQLISEPEAAAVYTLKAIQANHMQVGDNFVVCDAGMLNFETLLLFLLTATRWWHRRPNRLQNHTTQAPPRRRKRRRKRRSLRLSVPQLPL
jgi:hypothetical protein